MKGEKIMGVIWLVIAVALGIVLAVNLKTGKKHNVIHINSLSSSVGVAQLYETKTFSKNQFNTIDIDMPSATIAFERCSDDKITVELYCTDTTVPKVEVVQNTLKISETKSNINISFGRKIVVKVPANYNASTIDVRTASGSINLSDIEGSALNCGSTSGSVHLNNCKFDEIDLDTTSGSIHIDGSFEKIEANSVSGSIHANLNKALKEKSEFNATSGSINLNIPKNSDLTIRYSVTSGSYNNAYSKSRGKSGTDVIGKGTVKLNVGTTSGSINIR